MINNDKWINSLPNANLKHNQESAQIDNNKWVNTIPKFPTIPKKICLRFTFCFFCKKPNKKFRKRNKLSKSVNKFN